MSYSRTLRILGVTTSLFVVACFDDGDMVDTEGSTGVDSATSMDDTLGTSTTTSPISESASETETSDTTPTGGTMCGDGAIDGDEACDGADLGGATCITEGFDGGTLLCLANCTLDTGGCATCGDESIDPGEDCDGADLAGQTCESLGGFAGGTLACGSDCTFDTSQCQLCGNGMIDAGEPCDGDLLGDETCAGQGMGFTGGELGCSACSLVTDACTSFPNPDAAGQVIITEIMQNPQTLGDDDGEYFEVYNPSPTDTFQLQGCSIAGNQSDTGFEIEGSVQVGPQGYAVFATDSSVDQGFVPDAQWPQSAFSLNNAIDRVAVVCGGVVIDEVSYDDGTTFPDPNGASMSLDPGSFDAVLNDDGARWCEATSDFNGDLGTPGAANDVCPVPVTYTIDFCRLQFPTVIDAETGTDVDVFGRLFVAGLTDTTGVNDVASEVIGYVGYGPDGTDPAVDAGWMWTVATPNADYDVGSPNYEVNIDEYVATLTVPDPGTYDFAFRFSGDSGLTFTYCDGQTEGSSNGYAAVDAGQMDATAPAMYFSEYLEGANFDKALEVYNASSTQTYDLTDCEVRFYVNGAAAPTETIALAGDLASDSTYVLCDDGISNSTACDQTSNVTFFNGDDAVELACSGLTLDVIGQIGVDPGAEWEANGVGTQDEGLRRDCSVTSGDADGSDAFDPSVQWATFAQDDFSNLGQYVCPPV